MRVYNYNEEGFFISEGIAQENPLRKGNFLFPANSTDIKPLKEKEGFNIFFNGKKWTYKKKPKTIEELEAEAQAKAEAEAEAEAKAEEARILAEAEANKPTEKELKEIDLNSQLLEIDIKKIRAITDFLLTDDKTRLEELEAQAEAIRVILDDL